MLKQMTHVSVAVNDIHEGIDLYSKLFNIKLVRPIGEPSPYGFRAAWLGDESGAFIEILEPTEPDSAVARFLKARGEGLYLVGFGVENLASSVEHVRSQGGRITGIPEGEDPGPDARVAWVHPASTKGVLVELQNRSS